MIFIRAILFLIVLIVFNSGCATKGLLTDEFPEAYYKVPKLLNEIELETNPNFIVYGDTQPAWMVENGFLKASNWKSWKMALFPVYEVYLISTGLYGGFNYLRNMPDSGSETRRLVRDAIYKDTEVYDVSFVLNTGDIMGQDGRRPKNWQIFLDDYKNTHSFLDDIPYIPTMGNHERTGDVKFGRRNYEAVFDYPAFYTLEFPDLEIFVVSSSDIIDWKKDIDDDKQDRLFREWFVSDDENEPAWLERELSKSVKAFKIVSMHHSPFSFGKHWIDWYKPAYGHDIVEKRAALIKLMSKYGVQVVFSGHDHVYQRNVLKSLPGVDSDRSAMNFIVSSGGGTTIREVTKDEKMNMLKQLYLKEGYDVDPVVQISEYHYCLVDITSETMTITTYAVTEVETTERPVLDRIVINNSNSH